MVIIRAPRQEEGFTILRNDVLRDSELSFRARGILAFLLSHADNWRTDADSIAKQTKEGRQAIQTALKELKAAGYIKQVKEQDKATGRWSTQTFVYESPQNNTVKPTNKKATRSASQPNASIIVSEVWESKTQGKTAQPPVAVVKIVSNALNNGVKETAIRKALTDIAAAGLTVTTTRLDQAMNGKLASKNLKADQATDWSALKDTQGSAAL